MICDECGKNEAVVHIVQIGPNGRVEKNICLNCAARYGESMLRAQLQNVSAHDFLKGIFSSNQPKQGTEEAVGETMSCPSCGMPFKDVLESGVIGCSVCYQTFHKELLPLLRRVHGASIHRGKIPRRTGSALVLKHESAELKRKLQEAIESEKYEQAAELRDRIRELENHMAKESES